MLHLLTVRKIINKLNLAVWSCPICKQRLKQVSPCDSCALKIKTTSAYKPNTPYQALFVYNEFSRKLIHGIKYKNYFGPIDWLADQYIQSKEINLKKINIITWIPASRKQRAKRGYDQCQLLAQAISSKTNIPYYQLIKRLDDIPQTHRKDDRYIGPNLVSAFLTKPKIRSFNEGQGSSNSSSGCKILLLDDVITTGTSIDRGKLILESCGAKSVQMFAIAIVPKLIAALNEPLNS